MGMSFNAKHVYGKVWYIFIFSLFIIFSDSVLAKPQFTPLSTLHEKVSAGVLDIYQLSSSTLISSRRVLVWRPKNYNPDFKYAVMYMHDGQMLFDSQLTWNKQEWGVDEVAQQLMNNAQVKPFIVVAIDNGGDNYRHSDYFPEKPFQQLSNTEQQRIYRSTRSNNMPVFKQPINSDNYVSFLVDELKPFIDDNYPVFKDKDNTFIMGSSMGGLISMYAVFERPDVFGGAACLSTHWPGVFLKTNNPIPAAFTNYIKSNIKNLGNNLLYFDYGDKTLDSLYPPLQKNVDMIFKDADYQFYQSTFYPGADHSENSWRLRLDKPLLFLLKNK